MLANWPFEQASAKRLFTAKERARAQDVGRRISGQWRGQLRSAGLWSAPSGGLWTRELIRARAAIVATLRLSPEDLRIAILSLRASREEFRERWWEFCVASPGNIDWYGVAHDDLEALAVLLEEHGERA